MSHALEGKNIPDIGGGTGIGWECARRRGPEFSSFIT